MFNIFHFLMKFHEMTDLIGIYYIEWEAMSVFNFYSKLLKYPRNTTMG